MRSVLVLLVAVGCARSFAEAPKNRGTTPELAGKSHGVPGEQMEYLVKLRGVNVARVQVAVGQPGVVKDRAAIVVRSQATTTGLISMFGDLTWNLTTTIDIERGTPISEDEEFRISFKGKHEHENSSRTWPESDHRHNVQSAAGAIRAWQSSINDEASIVIMFDHMSLGLELRDVGREFLAEAKQPAARYQGTLRDKYPVTLWISDDQARVPLRMSVGSKWGDIEVELVHYEVPSDH